MLHIILDLIHIYLYQLYQDHFHLNLNISDAKHKHYYHIKLHYLGKAILVHYVISKNLF